MNWDLIIDDSAKKFLKKIPRRNATRITAVFGEFAINPYSGDIQKMEGEINIWRRRIGDYRIFYEINQDKRFIYVFEIKRRTSKTY